MVEGDIHVPAVAEAPAAVESFDVDPVVVAERSCSAVANVSVAAAVAQDLPCDDAALENAAAEHCAAGAVAYAAYDAAAAAAAVAVEHAVDAVDENDDSAVLPAVDAVA